MKSRQGKLANCVMVMGGSDSIVVSQRSRWKASSSIVKTYIAVPWRDE